MYILLTILLVLVAFLLIVIVLLQEPKEGGISSGLSTVGQFGGVQKAADFLEKGTWVLFACLIILSILIVGLDKKQSPTITEPTPTETTSEG